MSISIQATSRLSPQYGLWSMARMKKQNEKHEKMNKLAKLKTWKGGLGKNEHPVGLTTYEGNSGRNRGNEKNLFPGGSKTRKGDSGKNGIKKTTKTTKTNKTKARMQKALTTDAIAKACSSLKHPAMIVPSKRFYSLRVYEWDAAPCPQPWSRCVFQTTASPRGFPQAYVRAWAITCPIFQRFVYLCEIVSANFQPSCASSIHTCIIMHPICSCIW